MAMAPNFGVDHSSGMWVAASSTEQFPRLDCEILRESDIITSILDNKTDNNQSAWILTTSQF